MANLVEDVFASACTRAFAAPLLAWLLAGCASQAYDPVPPAGAPLIVLRIESPLSLEESYRTLYARLQDCLGASSYRVQPRFEREAGRAWIMVVSGLGLDRLSFLGNRFAARFDIHPAAPGAAVDATLGEPELEPLARAARGWLVDGSRACSG